MAQFDRNTIKAMQTALDDVCSHIPQKSVEARRFVASKMLECAGNGNRSRGALLAAGRRAVIDQFGSIEAVRRQL